MGIKRILKKTQMERRRFLSLAGAGTAALIGSSSITSRGWARPPGMALAGQNACTVRTHEHFGDIEETLTFPGSWGLEIQNMAGHGSPALDPGAIRKKLDQPIDCKPLKELAAGKKTAVITFDDLTRPTPAEAVLKMLVEDLRAAGLEDRRIMFLTSYGSHRPMTHAEARSKLGDWVVDNFIWLNHNIWENLIEVGVTSRANQIKVNHDFARADLRITVSGIKPHGTAGYGGGAKAVLPGVAWAESIDYFHRTINSNGNKTVGMAKVFENDVRQDMEEAARLAKVDFSVQIIYNEKREPVEVFAGDIVTSHHAACRMANKFMTTPTAKDADIVVANGYPQNRQAITSLSWARRSLRDGGSAVLIAQHPDALSTIHYLGERWNYRGRPYWEVKEAVESPVRQAAQIIVLAQHMQKRDRVNLPEKGVHVVRSWGQVMEQLQKLHKGDPRVAIYPYAPLQHPELELT